MPGSQAHDRTGQPVRPPFDSPRPIRFAPFTALLIETERFRQAGGLNEELGTYMEDVEFGLRCSLAGWTSVYTNHTGGKLDFLDFTAATAARRFYRTLGLSAPPTNAGAWTPVTDWLQASGSPMHYTTTNANAGLRLFRVEVRP